MEEECVGLGQARPPHDSGSLRDPPQLWLQMAPAYSSWRQATAHGVEKLHEPLCAAVWGQDLGEPRAQYFTGLNPCDPPQPDNAWTSSCFGLHLHR